jgi:hypothetical protein
MVKVIYGIADVTVMINPVSTYNSHVDQLTQTSPKPNVSAQKQNSNAPQDKVALKSTGDVDHDGDSK